MATQIKLASKFELGQTLKAFNSKMAQVQLKLLSNGFYETYQRQRQLFLMVERQLQHIWSSNKLMYKYQENFFKQRLF